MEKKPLLKLSVVLPLLSLVVSTVVLLFGNNIVDRFTGPNIIMNSTKVNLDYPKDMAKALKEYATGNIITNFPDSYEVIKIMNKGFIASKNANIQIKVGGDIYEISFFSTENVTFNKQIDNSTYNIQVPRLSKNAYIELKVWIKGNNQPVSIIYADDFNSRQLVQIDLSSEQRPSFVILMVAIMAISLFYLIKRMIIKFSNNLEDKRIQQEYDFLIKLSEMLDEKEEKEQEDKHIYNADNVSEKTQERLKQLIRKARDI